MLLNFVMRFLSGFYKLANTKVIILGNQKSGTTAIAKLLADSINRNVLLDTPLLWEPSFSNIKRGKLSLEQIIQSNKYFFSKTIVKEPNLTFFLEEILRIYPSTVKYVFIVRDPRDNIRSLLNRVNLPGDLESIDPYYDFLTKHEKVLFNREVMSYSSHHYVEQLSERWNQALSNYEKYQERILLVKYEDFQKNKILFIENLAKNLGLKPISNISSKIDIQYQPKGNTEISWLEFYGRNNLSKIEKCCRDFMVKMGY